ncbi:hypothetical protein GCK32_017707, partial [Trichostrongylus colubriformis]
SISKKPPTSFSRCVLPKSSRRSCATC